MGEGCVCVCFGVALAWAGAHQPAPTAEVTGVIFSREPAARRASAHCAATRLTRGRLSPGAAAVAEAVQREVLMWVSKLRMIYVESGQGSSSSSTVRLGEVPRYSMLPTRCRAHYCC